MKDFPVSDFMEVKGKTVETVVGTDRGDEGLVLVFTDGTALRFAFAGREGVIELLNKEGDVVNT